MSTTTRPAVTGDQKEVSSVAESTVASSRFIGWKELVPPLLIVVFGGAVYSDSFAAAFVWDDFNDILRSEKIRDFWSALGFDGPSWLKAGSWRPVVHITFWANYALGGDTVWGYHAVNLAVHLIAGLALYGIVRRTLLLEPFRKRFEAMAPWLAGAVALLWTVHPLQTEAVTYIVHRYESMMGMFYLLTLYCVLRGATASRWAWCWYSAAVIACAGGMGCKQVMITAPVLVLVYDRMFLARSWKELVAARGALYAGLACTWIVILPSFLSAFTAGQAWAGFQSAQFTKWEYASSQPGVILYYLGLALWPGQLCFDHGWPKAEGAGIVVPMLVILPLLGATLYGIWRRHWLGYVGAWFFGVLSVTSSILPIADLAVERRMYLSLAAVCVLVVIGGYQALQWARHRFQLSEPVTQCVGAVLVLVIVFCLGGRTLARNLDYYTEEELWRDVIAQHGNIYRGHCNLGVMLIRRGQYPEALAELDHAIELKPEMPFAFRFKGIALQAMGKHQEALAAYQATILRNPGDADTHNLLGTEMKLFNNRLAAAMHFQQALRLKPRFADAHNNLGALYLEDNQLGEARLEFQKVIELNPNHAGAYVNLGLASWRLGDPEMAKRYWQRGLKYAHPTSNAAAAAHFHLGAAYAAQGKWDEAVPELEKALQVSPSLANAHDLLGEHCAQQDRLEEALQHFEAAVRTNPRSPVFQKHRGATLLHLGRPDEAAAALAEAVRLAPKDWMIRCYHADALAAQGKAEKSREEYKEALHIKPDWPEVTRTDAWTLATHPDANRRGAKRSLQLARRVCAVTDSPKARDLDVLAAACAENGKFDDAVSNAEKALELARSGGDTKLAEEIDKRLALYRMKQPYHEPNVQARNGGERPR
jgi:tetratricopeptide (TPR) repeat protein